MISSSQYGIWLTLGSIINWFSFFDFGFTQGLRNRFSEAKANNDILLGKIYVSTTYVSLLIFFGVLACLFNFINLYIDWTQILNIDKTYEESLKSVFAIVFSSFCLQMVLKIINTLLTADQRPAIVSFMEMFIQIIVLIFVLLYTFFLKGNLVILAWITSLAPLFTLIFSTFFWGNKYYKQYIPSVKCVDLSQGKDLVGMGGKFFLIQISWVVIFQCVNFFILRILGAENVTLYNVIFKYYNTIVMFSFIFLNPFWSAFTEAYVKKDYSWMRTTYKKLRTYERYFIILTITAVLCSPLIFKIWIGTSIKIPFLYSILMGGYTILMVKSNLYITLIAGIGKICIQTIIDIVCALLTIPLLILLCKEIGIAGAIIASSLMPIAQSYLGKKQLDKILSGKAIGLWNK